MSDLDLFMRWLAEQDPRKVAARSYYSVILKAIERFRATPQEETDE